jgi:hypothetical protein
MDQTEAGSPPLASMVTLAAILVLSFALDFGWKRARAGRADHVRAVH